MSLISKVMTDSEHNKEKMDVQNGTSIATIELDVSKPNSQPLIEIKNSKVLLHQKALSFEKMSETMQEIVQFRVMIERREKENCSPLKEIPEEHLPLIAKLTHESEKTLSALSKQIQHALQPVQISIGQSGGNIKDAGQQQSQLSATIIESAIGSIATRINYGIDCVEKPPTTLCVWRWEVKEEKWDWLPLSSKGTLSERILERLKAKKNIIAVYQTLPEDQKQLLLTGNRKDKAKNIENIAILPNGILPDADQLENSSAISLAGSEVSKGAIRTKKELDPEKAAKEKERAEKRAAKAEKERKEREAQKKSRNLLSAFLKKPQKSSSSDAKGVISSLGESSRSCSPEKGTSVSEFEKVFKPFVVKKDATVAPVNCFKRNSQTDVIVIDQEESETRKTEISSNNNVMDLSLNELLKQAIETSLSALPERRQPSNTTQRNKDSSDYKISYTYCVRNILEQLNEAEVSGDTITVRGLTDLLRSRSAIPAKVLIFHEDLRPGYFGTFTKSSTVVGPRSPWSKDVISLDYGYDSGAEWEEEEEGADDVMSVDGSAEEDEPSIDSDLDDWLVDDDEVIDIDSCATPTLIEPYPDSPLLPLPKRKAESTEKQETKKRKVVPLVPYTKGPCWEEQIGVCESEVLKPYRIQLFNDISTPIDPFTFVAKEIFEDMSSTIQQKFVVPALPNHVLHSVQNETPVVSAVASISTPPELSATMKRKSMPAAPPKTTFPEQLVPDLIKKIGQLETGNLMGIVETIFQEFKDMKVKKNAIEAKVKEVAEKCRFKKIWIVKEQFLQIATQELYSR